MRGAAAYPHIGAVARTGRIDLGALLRHLPARVREGRFWFVQGLVFVITLMHYGLEMSQGGDEISSFHHIPVTVYVVAVVYAGIHYGREGGILTALWAAALTVPSITIWHRDSLMWLGELAQLFVSLAVGAVVAWRVELEASHRRQAEATAQRLTLLHNVSTTASRSLELERVLDRVLAQAAEAVGSERAWLSTWERPSDTPALVAQIGEPIRLPNRNDDEFVWQQASHRIQETAESVALADVALAVPLAAEGRLYGALGVACRGGRAYSGDEQELLTAIANYIAVAMDNARLYRDERHAQDVLRQYTHQVTRAQEDERRRIARELHDEAIQNLVLLCRQLDLFVERADGRTRRRREQVAEIRNLAEATLHGLRRFSRDLRPSVLDDLGLIPAIEWLTADLSKRTNIDVSVEVRGDVCRLHPEAELLLFRIAQEALRNTEKHSCASKARVSVTFALDHVRLTVEDNGRGFHPGPLTERVRSGQLGLLGMEERAKLLGATFDIQSDRGSGTKVELIVPSEHQANART